MNPYTGTSPNPNYSVQASKQRRNPPDMEHLDERTGAERWQELEHLKKKQRIGPEDIGTLLAHAHQDGQPNYDNPRYIFVNLLSIENIDTTKLYGREGDSSDSDYLLWTSPSQESQETSTGERTLVFAGGMTTKKPLFLDDSLQHRQASHQIRSDQHESVRVPALSAPQRPLLPRQQQQPKIAKGAGTPALNEVVWGQHVVQPNINVDPIPDDIQQMADEINNLPKVVHRQHPTKRSLYQAEGRSYNGEFRKGSGELKESSRLKMWYGDERLFDLRRWKYLTGEGKQDQKPMKRQSTDGGA